MYIYHTLVQGKRFHLQSAIFLGALTDISLLNIDGEEHTSWEIQCREIIPCGHILIDILVEELQHKWNTIGKHQMLPQIFELVNMVDFEVLEEEQ